MKNHNNLNMFTGTITAKTHAAYTVVSGLQTQSCTISTRLAQAGIVAVVGDRVVVEPAGKITAILPRRNQFSRPGASRPGGQAMEQVIAANLDLIVAVLDGSNPRWGLLDRYLALAEARGIAAMACINKVDLVDRGAQASLEETAGVYRRSGYMVMAASAASGMGLDSLSGALTGRTAMLVGHSGAGKTSLINALAPELNLRTGAVNPNTGKGRHTTTSSTLYLLPNGLQLMDSAGMREFGLWDVEAHEVAMLFPEMRPYLGRCRFGLDCLHDEEPDCAVRQAVMAGTIHPLRYQSYVKLLAEGKRQ